LGSQGVGLQGDPEYFCVLLGDSTRGPDAEHVRRDAVRDGSAEKTSRLRGDEQARHRPGPGGFPRDRDVVRVPAEGDDVVTHPAQCRRLVEQTTVLGTARNMPEALEPE